MSDKPINPHPVREAANLVGSADSWTHAELERAYDRAVAAEAALAEANEELSAANAAIEAWKDARETWVAEANQQARDLADALFNHGYGPGQCTCERCAALDRHTQADK